MLAFALLNIGPIFVDDTRMLHAQLLLTQMIDAALQDSEAWKAGMQTCDVDDTTDGTHVVQSDGSVLHRCVAY